MAASLPDLLNGADQCLGTWSQIASPEMVDLVALNGFQFTIIDCEHGYFGIETAEGLSRACDANGIPAAVRVPSSDPKIIMKALDAGIRHVVVPNMSGGEEAARAVAATRFAPHGLRGACPCVRSGGHFIRNWTDYVAAEEDRVGVIALVETVEGYENFAEIAATDGLRAVMFGAFDLSVSMGLEGNWRDARVQDAVHGMVDRAVDAGLPVMMPVFSPNKDECAEMMAHWRARGVRCFVVGSDKILVADALHQWVESLSA